MTDPNDLGRALPQNRRSRGNQMDIARRLFRRQARRRWSLPRRPYVHLVSKYVNDVGSTTSDLGLSDRCPPGVESWACKLPLGVLRSGPLSAVGCIARPLEAKSVCRTDLEISEQNLGKLRRKPPTCGGGGTEVAGAGFLRAVEWSNLRS